MKSKLQLLVLIVLMTLPLQSQEIVQRMEPLNWWTGMQQTELQIMLYGPDIAKATFSINKRGIKLLRTQLTDNPNYVFLYLKIDKKAQAGSFDIRVRKNRKRYRIPYELKQRESASAMRESFTAADAVYLIMPDRFANGNLTNDSVPGYHQGVVRGDLAKRQGGDLEGIIQRIPYLADLGITALWTTPVFDNNDTRYSYHHYATSDYYKVDPRLGKNEDYRRLADEARRHGIKLILDVVPNHCGSAHWWLKDMPAKDWFNEWPEYTSSNYRMMAWTDPHASEKDKERLSKGWFAPNMPDLNLNNRLLFDYLKQVYIYWIEYAGVAGLRVDTYPYNDLNIAAEFIGAIRNEYPKMNVVGECWMNTPQEIAYYQSGNNNKDSFDSKLTSVMDFPLGVVMANAFTEKEGWNEGLARFYMHYALDFAYPDVNLLMNFLDNHDIDRYSAVVDGDVRLYKMALSMLITARGYPQIYYGTEIMLDGTKGSYEGHRYTFPGGWPTDERNAFEFGNRNTKEREVFDHLRTLLHYRKKTTALQTGKMKHFVPSDGCYVYFRYDEKSTVMVVANNNDEVKVLPMERYDEVLLKVRQGRDILTGDAVNFGQGLIIPAKSVRVIEL